MERPKGEYAKFLDSNFKSALFFWKQSPDDPAAIEKMRSLIYEVSDLEMGIIFKITDQIMRSSDGRRAILPADLKKYSKHEDGAFIFNFGAKKSTKAEFTLTAKMLYGQPLLILHSRRAGMIGMFRPHEIDSINTL